MGLTIPGTDNSNRYSAEQLKKLFVENGSKIFSERKEDLLSRIGSLTKLTNLVTQNPYAEEDFEKLLDDYFGDTKLGECLTSTLVTSYEIQRGKPFYFTSRLAGLKEEENISMKEICRSTSAAPTFFEPSLVSLNEKEKIALVDGGVFANNPSVLAYGEAKELWKAISRGTKGFEAVVSADDNDFPFFMLSLGTGYSLKSIPYDRAKDWRAGQWAGFLMDILMRSVSESADFTMQHLLPPYTDGTLRYKRLNIDIPEENTKMDDVSEKNISRLCEIADEFIRNNESELLKICDILN